MRFPRFRPFTWVMLVINVLFLIWIIVGIAGASGTPEDCGTLSAEACNAAEGVGTAIGAGLIIGLWVAADVILGVLWLITRPKRRDCPACGHSLRKGVTTCPKCGTNLATLYQQPGTTPGGPRPA